MKVMGHRGEKQSGLMAVALSMVTAFSGVSSIALADDPYEGETVTASDTGRCYRPDSDTLYELGPSGRAFSESFADFLYLVDVQHDSLRRARIRFWGFDTLDGWYHSNDSILTIGDPVFVGHVTSCSYIGPGGIFLDSHRYHPCIDFPYEANEIRDNASLTFGTQGPDSLTQIVLSGENIYVRKGGYFHVNGVDIMRCWPPDIASAPVYQIPESGVIFVNGRCWISASRGQVDRMDGLYPESSYYDGGFISEGFSGRLTIGSSDTMIITDNLIYQHSRPDFSIPPSFDSCADMLGLVSENYIMVGRTVRDTVYINAAMAAISGSISVQDIYMNQAPGWDNEKEMLAIWGSLAQRNRGITHTTDYPPGHLRGFIFKKYRYDSRLHEVQPPFFPRVNIGDTRNVD